MTSFLINTSCCISHWSTCHQSIGSQDSTQWWPYSHLSPTTLFWLCLDFLILNTKNIFLIQLSHFLLLCIFYITHLHFSYFSIALLCFRIKVPYKNCLPLLLLISTVYLLNKFHLGFYPSLSSSIKVINCFHIAESICKVSSFLLSRPT